MIYLKQRAFANPIYRKKEKTLLFQLTISSLCFEIPPLNCKGLLLDALVADIMAPFLAQLAKFYLGGLCVPILAICMKRSPKFPNQEKIFMEKWLRYLF